MVRAGTRPAGGANISASVPFARVLCSDLARSVETARHGRPHFRGDHRIDLEILPELREIDLGDWECRAMADVRRDFPDQFEARGRDMAGFRPPGGESFRDLSERVIPVIETLAREVHGNVLLAGHAGVNRVILCHVLGLPLAGLFRLGQDHGCLNVISWGASGPVLRLLNLPPDGDLF